MRRNPDQPLAQPIAVHPALDRADVTAGPALDARAVAEWIAGRELVWLALLSPLFLFPARAWAWVVGVLPALWIARWVARGRLLPRTPLDWPIALLAAMVPVSLFATFSIDYSLGKVEGLLFGISVYYALVEWGSDGRRLGWATGGFLAGGAGLALVGLVGTNWMDKFQGMGAITSKLPTVVRGLPGAENGIHPNEMAGALLWVVLPALALVIHGRPSGVHRASRTWVATLLVFLLCLGTMVLTQSRGALTAGLVGLVALLFLLLPRVRIWLAGAALVALAAVLIVGPGTVVDRLFDPAVPRFPTSDPANMRVRVDVWSSALAAIHDAPLTGIGMNTFREIMPERYPSPFFPPGYDVAHAHNIFLQTALDLGLPGMLAFLAIWVIAGVLFVQAWRRLSVGWERAALAGVATGLLAFLVFGMTDAITLGAKPDAYFWAALALVVLLWGHSSKREAAR